MTKKELSVWKQLEISSDEVSLEKYLEIKKYFKEVYDENTSIEENVQILLLIKEII